MPSACCLEMKNSAPEFVELIVKKDRWYERENPKMSLSFSSSTTTTSRYVYY